MKDKDSYNYKIRKVERLERIVLGAGAIIIIGLLLYFQVELSKVFL